MDSFACRDGFEEFALRGNYGQCMPVGDNNIMRGEGWGKAFLPHWKTKTSSNSLEVIAWKLGVGARVART